MKTVLRILVVAALIPTLLYGAHKAEGAQAGAQSASNLFQEAMHLEEVVGDLPAAIRLYQRVVEEFSTQRSLAADALVRMGRGYEKLDDGRASVAYERVLSDYGDQPDAVAEARSRLASLQSEDEADRKVGLVTRQVWPDAPMDTLNISPDGRYVAFVLWETDLEKLRRQFGGDLNLLGGAELSVYDTETGRAQPVTNYVKEGRTHEYVTDMAWSRDGARIAYSRWPNGDYAHQELRVVRADGSDDHILFDGVERSCVGPMVWSRDGDFIVCRFNFWDRAGLLIGTISTEDGTIQILKTVSQGFSTLSLSPDDRYIVYATAQADGVQTNDVFILATDGSSEERLVSHAADDTRPFWTPDGGRVVFLSDRSGRPGLYAVEVRDGRPAGDPELIRPDVGGMVTLGFNRSGALYYRLNADVENVYVAEIDLNGLGTLSEPSPLTERFEGTNFAPSWSPDGRRIAFLSRRGHDQRVYAVVKSLDTGEEHDFALPFALLRGVNGLDSPGWSADGRHLLIEGHEIGKGLDLSFGDRGFASYRLDTETGEVARETFYRDVVGLSANLRFATPAQSEALRAAGVRIIPNGLWFRSKFQDGERPLRPDEDLMWLRGRRSAGVSRMLPSGDVQEFGPRGNVRTWALSPDGTQLAWAISTDLSSSLLIMPVTGGAIRELTRLLRPSEGDPESQIVAIRWASDGQKLLYHVGRPRRPWGYELWQVPAEGGAPARLDVPLDLGRVRFHPDGRSVVLWTAEQRNEIGLMEGFPWQDSGR